MTDFNCPIAIVGIGCRFPGGAHDLDGLWKVLVEGRNVWSEVPKNRFNWEAFHHPDGRDANSSFNHRGGHFLEQDVAAFDAPFFNISSSEAKSMDPQQRILLEVAYEAIENAGIPLEGLKGSKTGSYVATFVHDYENMQYKSALSFPRHTMTGIGHAIYANRISYVFDLKGPSMTLDTGCSGSLVALHLACQSLRSRESNMALVGGTNLILNPDTMMPMHLIHLLNPEGRCFSFDQRGSGYGRAEGVSVVVLKRLDDALEANDHVHAVIRQTVTGQDGRTAGITRPSGTAQVEMIKEAYERASLDPADTGYVEAHGTGTTIGDVTEMDAISKVFGGRESRTQPIFVGSVKANIGHTESTSGLAGLIKAVLILSKRQIPPTPNLNTMKSGITFDKEKFQIARSLTSWPPGSLSRASVNSFGYGGANSHAVIESLEVTLSELHVKGKSLPFPSFPSGAGLNSARNDIVHGEDKSAELLKQEYPTKEVNTFRYEGPDSELKKHKMFLLSGRSESALSSYKSRFHQWLLHKDRRKTDLDDLAYTLCSRRTHMSWRYAFAASSSDEAIAALQSQNGRCMRKSNTTKIIFIFTGQGAQGSGMARELMTTSALFRASLQRSDAILKNLGAAWNLIEELNRPEETTQINNSRIAQPVTTAVQLALVDLYHDLNAIPSAVLGHSSGEIAAAYAAGALSQEEAITVAYCRSFVSEVCERLKLSGAMLAVALGEKEVSSYLERLSRGRALIACVNSPVSTTVSGDETAIKELKHLLEQFGVSSRQLKVDTAYHSHHMQAVAPSYRKDLDQQEFACERASTRLYSSVTATEKNDEFDANYWVTNLVSKVRFQEALESLCTSLHQEQLSEQANCSHIFLEIGPHSALAGPVKQTISSLKLTQFQWSYMSALVRKNNSVSNILQSAAVMWERGCPVNIHKANSLSPIQSTPRVLSDLPSYSWDHSASYWHEPRTSREHRFRAFPYHDLLGVQDPSTTIEEPTWRHLLSTETLPWLKDHVVDGCLVFPATGFIVMAIEAKKQIISKRNPGATISSFVLRDISFTKYLEIPSSSDTVEIQLTLRDSTESDQPISAWQIFRISSLGNKGSSVTHCHGLIKSEVSKSNTRHNLTISNGNVGGILPESGLKQLDMQHVYKQMKDHGNYWGPSFALIRDFKVDPLRGEGKVTIPDTCESMPGRFAQPHLVHPTVLDALLHSSLLLFGRTCQRSVMLPTGIRELKIDASLPNAAGNHLEFSTTIQTIKTSNAIANIKVFCPDSSCQSQSPCIQISGAELTGAAKASNHQRGVYAQRRLCYSVEWEEDVDLSPRLPEIQEKNDGKSGVPEPTTRLDLLNRAAMHFINSALQLVEERTVKTTYASFYAWMRRLRKDLLDAEEPWFDITSSSDIHSYVPDDIERQAVSMMGPNLASVLTGYVDPLSLLLKDDLLGRLYAESPPMLRCYSHLAEHMKRLTFKYPNLKVLEIGAGTGGGTLPLLRALDHSSESHLKQYDFTDVSSGFFDNAKAKLAKWKNILQFKKLDIARDPSDQGFEPGTYDVVIACNSLHVTRDIDEAISNARKLLKPNGRLLLIEITNRVPYVSLIFGLLSGWHQVRKDGRENSPLLTVNEWRFHLSRNAFHELESVVPDAEGYGQIMNFMASRRISSFEDSEASTNNKISLAYKDYNGARQLTDCFVAGAEGFKFSLRRETLPIQHVSEDEICLLIDSEQADQKDFSVSEISSCVSQLSQKAIRILLVTMKTTRSALGRKSTFKSAFDKVRSSASMACRLIHLEVEALSSKQEYCTLSKVIFYIMRVALRLKANETSYETCYRFRQGRLLIPRLKPLAELDHWMQQSITKQQEIIHFQQDDRTLELTTGESGLENLCFVDRPMSNPADRDYQIRVQPLAFGVDMEQALIGSGRVRTSKQIFNEFAGVVAAVHPEFRDRYRPGDRVCGWGEFAFASQMITTIDRLIALPSSVSYTQAAVLPHAFLTAWQALVNVGNISRDQKVLICACVESLGQAAIQIARHYGAEVVATVSTSSEKDILIDAYSIPPDNVILEGSSNLEVAIERLTQGSGLDLVLGSVSAELPFDQWSCVAPFGRVIEIGSVDSSTKRTLRPAPSDQNIIFATVDIRSLVNQRPSLAHNIMEKVMALFMDEIMHAPQPLHAMDVSQMDTAFKFALNPGEPGKAVLEVSQDSQVKVVPRASGSLSLGRNETFMVVSNDWRIGQTVSSFLVSQGAENIRLVLSDSCKRDEEEFSSFIEQMRKAGVFVELFYINLLAENKWDKHPKPFPAIKGIMQCNIGSEIGLELAFDCSALDFFLVLELVQEAFPLHLNLDATTDQKYSSKNGHSNAAIRKVHLQIPQLTAKEVEHRKTREETYSAKDGVFQVNKSEFFSILKYAVTSLRKSNERNLVLGFDRQSLEEWGKEETLQNPIFSHLPFTTQDSIVEQVVEQVSPKDIQELFLEAETEEAGMKVATLALQNKIASYVAIDQEMVDLKTSIEDFGLDSLITFRMRNWVFQNFKATLEPSEISDAPSILFLVSLIMERTKAKTIFKNAPNKAQISVVAKAESPTITSNFGNRRLPRQPLPSLDDTVRNHLDSIGLFCSPEENARLERIATEFASQQGPGRKLNDYLVHTYNDPIQENWLSDMYLDRRYLRPRTSVVGTMSYFGTHSRTRYAHSQTERAAIVTLAALRFKQNLEKHRLETQYLYGNALDSELYPWLFNSAREPGHGRDTMRKYPASNNIVVLCRGQAFQIAIQDDVQTVSLQWLAAMFDHVLRTSSKSMSWLSILTTGNRDEWAKLRSNLIEISDENKISIQAIEQAAFIVCLDDSQPNNSEERFREFLFADGSNRWYDKTLQFIVCSNGESASLCEHSALDGVSVELIHHSIHQAIQDHISRPLPSSTTAAAASCAHLPLTTTPPIETAVHHQRQALPQFISKWTFSALELHSLSRSFLSTHRCPVQSGIQLAIQLASRRFFGHSPMARETVSLAHFRKGRVETNDILTREMLTFIDAVEQLKDAGSADAITIPSPSPMSPLSPSTSPPPPSTLTSAGRKPDHPLKRLAYAAAKSHAKNLTRASKGRGPGRHMLALEWMVDEVEEGRGVKPELFTDPAFLRTKPAKVLTSCFETGWREGGFVYPVPGGILLYFEVEEGSVKFSIFGNDMSASHFAELLEGAGREVSEVLSG